ncbi:unnamed protein product [Calicophoron daubneyi]|uniref:EGF-like domain-containing protein n=1 Tax=Calicophoron daubneyi TaxID=300641 RepID=A0AAV2T428_CALDB
MINDTVFDENRALESLKKFREHTRKHFCTTDELDHWKCCDHTIAHPSCQDVPIRAREVMGILRSPLQNMPVIFLYHWCSNAWDRLREGVNDTTLLETEIKRYCPDPCRGRPCHRLKGTAASKACTNTGPFENDYECLCDNKHRWDSRELMCKPKNPCADSLYPPCVMKNTLRCVAADLIRAVCICKAEYVGVDCSVLRNACLERADKSKENGNSNCLVQLGNRCLPIWGTDYYSCSCAPEFTSLISVGEPNCRGRLDPCINTYLGREQKAIQQESDNESDLEEEPVTSNLPSTGIIRYRGINCLNGGKCNSAGDFTHPFCICPKSSDGEPLFFGQHCEFPIGQWSSWTNSTSCFPKNCGRVRYRWRRRKCLNQTDPQKLVSVGKMSRIALLNAISSGSPASCSGTSEEAEFWPVPTTLHQ